MYPVASWGDWPLEIHPEEPLYLVRSETDSQPSLWLQVECSSESHIEDCFVIRLRDVTEAATEQGAVLRLHQLVSHKLRTALNHMYGPAQILEAEALDMPREEVRHMAEILLLGMDEMVNHVARLLAEWEQPTVARAANARFLLADLDTETRAVANELAIVAPTIRLPAELLSASLTLSPSGVCSILAEIMENSRKFHPRQQPRLEIEVERIDATRVRIRIQDDGISLCPSELTHIWRPFFQIDRHFTGEVPGLGLGLSLVATIVWSAGGQATFSNRAARPGTVLDLTLPLAHASPPAELGPPQPGVLAQTEQWERSSERDTSISTPAL